MVVISDFANMDQLIIEDMRLSACLVEREQLTVSSSLWALEATSFCSRMLVLCL